MTYPFTFHSHHYTLCFFLFFFLMIRRPPRSTLFPTRRSSDLAAAGKRRSRPRPGLAVAAPDRRPRSAGPAPQTRNPGGPDRKSTRLNSSHVEISYAVFCLKKKKKKITSKHRKLPINNTNTQNQ